MADTMTMAPFLSVCATTASRLSDLAIKNGQLIFVQDRHKIALDFKDKRVFYNSITEINTEEERSVLPSPVNGIYYFVIDTAVLWTYQNDEWIQITTSPQEVVFIGTELPGLGSNRILYVNKQDKNISIWDENVQSYDIVADVTQPIPDEDILALFN